MLFSDYLDLEPRIERAQQSALEDSPSTTSAIADRSWAVSRNVPGKFTHHLTWTDLGSVLGNFLGGAVFIGGMFLLPYALRQILSLL